MKKNNEIAIYKSKDGSIEIDVKLKNKTLWLDAHQIAFLFGIDRSGIVRHVNNIYKTKELSKKSTCAKIA